MTATILASCVGDVSPEAEDDPFTVRDSAGIELRVTDGAAARRPLPWLVDTVPDLELGGSDPGSGEDFFQITGTARLADGRILVVDRSSAEIRLFDRGGTYLAHLGGKGQGPGEFRAPVLVPPADPESILIYDLGRFGYTRLGLDGEPLYVSPSLGARMRYASSPAHVGDRVLLLDSRTPPHEVEEQYSTTAHFTVVDAMTLEADTIGDYPGVDGYLIASRLGELIVMDVPFDVMPSATADRTGFFVTAGEGPEIVRYDQQGQPQAILRLEEPPDVVTRDKLKAKFAADPGMTAEIEERVGKMRLPGIVPAFIGLRVDELGWLWAETFRYERNGPRMWVVFDPDGKGRGVVATPPRVEVRQIGADFILGLWRDSLNVEYVRRYPLSRAGMESR